MLLHLVQQLFREASTSIVPDNVRLQQVKEEVLLRAARFVHIEIWIEHMGWKYTQLGDRFEIGKRVTSFYLEVPAHAPPLLKERPFATLSQFVADALLFKAKGFCNDRPPQKLENQQTEGVRTLQVTNVVGISRVVLT